VTSILCVWIENAHEELVRKYYIRLTYYAIHSILPDVHKNPVMARGVWISSYCTKKITQKKLLKRGE
jgi:hypothetical protein